MTAFARHVGIGPLNRTSSNQAQKVTKHFIEMLGNWSAFPKTTPRHAGALLVIRL
ncbi:MAG: hypothetical protein IV108_08870 [Burkholderiales bacterium]|nr:hypothetical protein [Burkholderiales bacterium]